MKDVDALVADARHKADIKEFDSDSWREGLEILVNELNTNPLYTPEGREQLYGEFVDCMWNRLRVTQYLEDHPQVLEERIERPLVVLGMPRTGTTVASYLLDEDPARRSLLNWEAGNTIPPATSETLRSDPRCLEKLDVQRATVEALAAAGIPVAHWEWADGPTECIFVQSQDFKAYYWEAFMLTPTYSDWLLECDMSSAYDYLKKVLQILQSKAPGVWNLKMPSHAIHIETLLATFPDVRMVWAHRDPYKALGSLCSAQKGAKASVSSRPPDLAYIGRNSVKQMRAHIHRAMQARQRIGDDRFFDLHYADLMRDAIGQMRLLYSWAGDSLSPEVVINMQKWLDDNPQGKFGRHTYSLEEYGIDQTTLDPIFAEYIEAYAIESEGE
jgi:hypothetical protein